MMRLVQPVGQNMSTTITANRLICVMNWTAADGVYKRSSVQHAEKLIACRTHFSRPRSSGNGFRGAVRPSYWRESDPVQECGPLRRGQNWSIEWHLDLATTADLIHMQAEYVGLYLYLPAQSPAGAHGATLMLYSVAYRLHQSCPQPHRLYQWAGRRYVYVHYAADADAAIRSPPVA